MDKLGSFINNLMVTIIDKEEKFFVRKLAFSELTTIFVIIFYHPVVNLFGMYQIAMTPNFLYFLFLY